MSLLLIISEDLKNIKIRCFNLTISKKDLTNLAFVGLYSYLKKKLEGFDFLSVNHLQMKVVGLEFILKECKKYL